MYDNNLGSSAANTPSSPPPNKSLRFDKSFVTTKLGILKVVQLACNLLGFICIKISLSAWISAIFYNILYWVGILITGFLLLMYTLHAVEKFAHWPWLKLELFYCVGMVLVYISLSILAATIGESAGYAVGFFGLVAILAYGYDGYLKYKAWKRGAPAQ